MREAGELQIVSGRPIFNRCLAIRAGRSVRQGVVTAPAIPVPAAKRNYRFFADFFAGFAALAGWAACSVSGTFPMVTIWIWRLAGEAGWA